jgi:hypothetical protein
VVFAAAAGVGVLAGPVTAGAPEHEGTTMTSTHSTAKAGATHGSGTHSAARAVPKGLQVSQDGYTLVPQTTTLPAAGGTYAFRILDRGARAVTDYTTAHGKNLHLIVVRRDLAGFAHVHPVMAPDGTWRVPLRPAAGAGSYRVFADFTPAGRDEALTLGTDLSVAGTYTPRPLPAAARTATVDGYTVALTGDLQPGSSSKLTLTVTCGGAPVTDLQPYLGAYGHLVALRAGDLAYLHVHPDGTPGDGRTRPGPTITFYAEAPTAGQYRLFLDFQHAGVVRTAEFTATAGGEATAPTTPRRDPAPAPSASVGSPGGTHGHGR